MGFVIKAIETVRFESFMEASGAIVVAAIDLGSIPKPSWGVG